MQHTALLHMARRHLRWLLCFALLLPVAQWASAAHALTHATDAGQRPGGPEPASHLQHCPVCPAAATVASGGMASAPVAWTTTLAQGGDVLDAPPAVAITATLRRPSNRGPPASLPGR